MDKIMEPLQRLGKALMGAVAVMPLAALMMGIGYWITAVGGEGAVIYGDLLLKTGAAVLDNLGVIFAIAIADGLSRDNSGAAALAGFVGFATLVVFLAVYFATRYVSLAKLAATLMMCLVTLMMIDTPFVKYLVLLTALVVFIENRHGIVRLIKGKEKKFRYRKDISYMFDE